jgi:transcriptional regulator with XRE-family HTH domain
MAVRSGRQVGLSRLGSAAGFEPASLATELGMSATSVRSWWAGRVKPSFARVEKIARALQTPLDDVMGDLWGERPGEPCDCGKCGGAKVLPAAPTALTLATERRCVQCGDLSRYREGSPLASHHSRCRRCGPGRGNQTRTVERISLTCVGYEDHRVRRFAPNCLGRLDLTRAQILYRGKLRSARSRSKFTESNPGFHDAARGEFRCDRCVASARVIAVREGRMRALTNERIQSRQQRIEIQRELWTVMFPGFAASRPSNGVPPPQTSKAQILRWWSLREGPPTKPQLSYCLFCTKITISQKRPARWHLSCFNEWQGTGQGAAYQVARHLGTARGIQPGAFVRERRGKPTDPDALKRHFQWAILNKAGGLGVREIAREVGVTHVAVSKAIGEILADMPRIELVRTEFQSHVRLLQGA